jgi:hypothetical protein
MMKTIITALALAALATTVAAPAFKQSAAAAPYERRDAGQIDQSYNGTYQGFPLREWYREDSW